MLQNTLLVVVALGSQLVLPLTILNAFFAIFRLIELPYAFGWAFAPTALVLPGLPFELNSGQDRGDRSAVRGTERPR